MNKEEKKETLKKMDKSIESLMKAATSSKDWKAIRYADIAIQQDYFLRFLLEKSQQTNETKEDLK